MSSYVIGDVHGCSRTLEELVTNKLCLKEPDQLYLVGDYIDRGPDSKGVLDFIIDIGKQYQVVPLMGNHEWMLLEAALSNSSDEIWLYNGGEATLESFGAAAANEVPAEYIDFIKSLKLYHELDKHLLVHAGFNLDVEDMYEDTNAMLWARYVTYPDDAEELQGRIVVHGHTPITREELVESVNNHSNGINLDTGCVFTGTEGMGYLAALDLDTRELIFQENIE